VYAPVDDADSCHFGNVVAVRPANTSVSHIVLDHTIVDGTGSAISKQVLHIDVGMQVMGAVLLRQ
jgi:hypothetical protein